MSDHHRRIGRLGGLATAETSEAIREYQASPAGKEAARARGRARAEGRAGGRWGESGMLGQLRVDSACEKRVAAFLMNMHPYAFIRRYSTQVDEPLYYTVLGEKEMRQWLPDLVMETEFGFKTIYEVKHLPGHLTNVRAQDVAEYAPTTANNIVAKSAAHPMVLIVNGASDEMRSNYAHLRATNAVPPFVPDREGAPDL